MSKTKQRTATEPLSIGTIDGAAIPTSLIDPESKQLIPTELFNATIKRKIAGYALSTIRYHGVRLNSWQSIEMDITPLPNAEHSIDVHFLTAGVVTHGLLGLRFNSLNNSSTGFDVIAVQPKRKYQC